MIRKTKVTIEITHESNDSHDLSKWDWPSLLEVDEVKVVSCEEMCEPQRTVDEVCKEFLEKHNDNSQEKMVAEFIADCEESDHVISAGICDEIISAAGTIKRRLMREADKHGGRKYSTPSHGDQTFDKYDDAVNYLNGEVDDGGLSHMIVIHNDGK